MSSQKLDMPLDPSALLARGALNALDVKRLLATSRDLPVRVGGGIRTAADLDDHRETLGAINASFADFETFDATDLEEWQRLAGAKRFTIVLGIDPRAPGVQGHTVPELRLVPTDRDEGLVRCATRGVRVDGTLSPRLVCDVETDTLTLTVYEPLNEGEPPLLHDEGREVALDDAWVVR